MICSECPKWKAEPLWKSHDLTEIVAYDALHKEFQNMMLKDADAAISTLQALGWGKK